MQQIVLIFLNLNLTIPNIVKKNCQHRYSMSNILTKHVRKLISILVLLLLVTPLYADNVLLSLEMKNKRMSEVLVVIEQQSGYRFYYNSKLINTQQIVSISVKDVDVFSALNQLFASTEIDYKVIDKDIILAAKDPKENSKQDAAAGRQGITVSGTVSDEKGAPMSYVNVIVKGTTTAAVTDADGKYTINVPDSNSVLVFSFIGYLNTEQAVGNRTVMDAVMYEDVNELEEVVVVGFGTQKKVNLTGAVGTVSSKDLADRPVANLQQALQGLMAGVNVQQTTGFINSTPSFNIRGIGTISQSAAATPLVLIDGVEGDITNLNPQDVENISVLKDAAASSIYGARAAFGVVLVTTKKGVTGTARVNYNNNFRWASPVVVPNPMESYPLTTYVNDACDNANSARFFSQEHIQRIKDYRDGKITTVNIPDPANPAVWANPYLYGNANNNFYDIMYKDWQFSQEHNLSVSGGKEGFTYYASFGYLDQNGLLKISDDKYRRYTPMGTIEAQVTKWMKFVYTSRFTRRDYDYPRNMVQGLYDNWGRQSWSYLPVYDDNGYYAEGGQIPAIVLGGRTTTQIDNYNNHGSLVIEPIKNWVTVFDINYNISNTSTHDVALPANYKHDVAGKLIPNQFSGQVLEQNTKENFMNMNLYSTYNLTVANNHNFKFMLGAQVEQMQSKFYQMSRVGLIVEDIDVIDGTTGLDYSGEKTVPEVSGNRNSWSTAGLFGRVNYDYKGKYLVEANLRYDGTSRYRWNERWNLFPSVSVGWNIANENFWENLTSYVNVLKFRGSYGMLGNQNTNSWYPTYLIMDVRTNAGTWLQDGKKTNIAYPPAMISTTLTWERVNTINVGVDVGAFQNRLTASFDYFVRKTLKMMGPSQELPDILGEAPPQTNNTDLRTYGFDFEIAWQDRLANGLQYSARFILSDNRTVVTRYPNQEKLLTKYYKGQIIGEFWGYETIDIARNEEQMQAHLAGLPNGGQDALGNSWAAGDIMYKDLNNDGRINNGSNTLYDRGDIKVIGNSSPRYMFGLDLHAGWKGFDFRAFFQGVAKRDFYTNNPLFFGIAQNGFWTMVPLKEHLDYYRAEASGDLPANIDSYYPRPLISGFQKNQMWQSRYVINAAYMRLKNLTLGYTLPKRITEKFSVSSLRFYLSGENLLTFTKVPAMYDPETIGGTDTYPLQKTMTMGLSVTF